MDLRKQGRGVSTTLIRLQAKEIANSMNIHQFSGNASWCFRFMRRNNLVIRQRTSAGKNLCAQWREKLSGFKEEVKDVCLKHGIDTLSLIANMDEVPCTFDLPAKQTVDEVGKRFVDITTTGNEKCHYTVVLACFANGVKIKPMIIFKGKRIPQDLPPQIHLICNNKAWMNEQVMKSWVDSCWKGTNNISIFTKRKLLLLDSMSSHKSKSVPNYLRSTTGTVVSIIPGGLTKFLQPLDVSINHVFKCNLRREWEAWMRSNMHNYAAGCLRRPSYFLVSQWINNAWEAIDTLTIKNAFIKAGVIPNFITADPHNDHIADYNSITLSDNFGNDHHDPDFGTIPKYNAHCDSFDIFDLKSLEHNDF